MRAENKRVGGTMPQASKLSGTRRKAAKSHVISRLLFCGIPLEKKREEKRREEKRREEKESKEKRREEN